jgi:glycine cleavage system transcriptional repressor
VPHFAITAIGRDRPGIVAALTGALRDVGGNLEDVSSTILRGHFTMMLVVEAPATVTGHRLRVALGEAVAPLGVEVTVSDVEVGSPDRPTATHVLSVYGSDHPGIVAAIASALAGRGANITDLSCRLTTADRPVYVMVAEVAVPDSVDQQQLRSDVESVAGRIGVDATLAPIDVETL